MYSIRLTRGYNSFFILVCTSDNLFDVAGINRMANGKKVGFWRYREPIVIDIIWSFVLISGVSTRLSRDFHLYQLIEIANRKRTINTRRFIRYTFEYGQFDCWNATLYSVWISMRNGNQSKWNQIELDATTLQVNAKWIISNYAWRRHVFWLEAVHQITN